MAGGAGTGALGLGTGTGGDHCRTSWPRPGSGGLPGENGAERADEVGTGCSTVPLPGRDSLHTAPDKRPLRSWRRLASEFFQGDTLGTLVVPGPSRPKRAKARPL